MLNIDFENDLNCNNDQTETELNDHKINAPSCDNKKHEKLIKNVKNANKLQLSNVKENNDLTKMNVKLVVPYNIWTTIFNLTTKKLLPKNYNHVIADLLSTTTGCQKNIKSKDIMKNHMVIRAYCGHSMRIANITKKCERKYQIVNKNFRKGIFDIFQSDEIPFHLFKKSRVIFQNF